MLCIGSPSLIYLLAASIYALTTMSSGTPLLALYFEARDLKNRSWVSGKNDESEARSKLLRTHSMYKQRLKWEPSCSVGVGPFGLP